MCLASHPEALVLHLDSADVPPPWGAMARAAAMHYRASEPGLAPGKPPEFRPAPMGAPSCANSNGAMTLLHRCHSWVSRRVHPDVGAKGSLGVERQRRGIRRRDVFGGERRGEL